jgi:outer membrane receptor protein involved in Fe transport
MKKLSTFILFLTLSVVSLNAQTPSPFAGGPRSNPGGENAAPSGLTIKGKVVESASHTPMEFANVVVYSAKDSTIAGGIMTSSNGTFEIKKLPTGNFYIRVNFIGFERATVSKIVLSPAKPTIDLGQIELKAATEQIGEVAVTAQKSRVEFKIDRRVVNVSQDLTATGGSAVEVLENTPSIQTDFEGNVTLRGSSAFTVLIDGKPSVLTGSDALRQIPATNIENIEIITNPSAKYDPDGTTGIINVIMKKNIKDSFSGLINLTAGLNNKYRGDMNFNYRTGKWNFLVGADFQDMNNKGSRDMNQLFFPLNNDTITSRVTSGDGSMLRKGQSVKGGFDYQASKNTSFGITGTIGNHTFGNTNIGLMHEYTNMNTPQIYTYQDNSSSRGGNYWSSDLNFQQKFNKKGHELIGLFYISGSNGDDMEYQTRYLTDSQWSRPIDPNYVKNRSSETSDEKEYRAKLDYTLPINEKDKLEAGYQARIEKENEIFNFEEAGNNNIWVNNPLFSSSFNYSSNIHSLYSTFSHAGEGFSYQLGMRGEYTDRSISSIQFPVPHKFNKFDFFPTLHFSQKLKNDFEFQASYSRRLNRPRANDLEPFTSYMDQYNVRTGNPDLEPEYTGSYDLTILKRIKTSFISLESYYRNTQGLITRIQTLRDDGIMVMSMSNLNNDYSLGAEFMANFEVKPGFRIIGSATLYNYWLKGAINGKNVDQSSTNFDSRLNLDMKLAKNTRLQLTGIYRGATASAQGTRDPMMFANAALKQDFLKNNLTATLQIQDIFGTMKFGGTTYGEGFQTQFKFKREPQVVQLTLSYKLNNFKSKQVRTEEPGQGNDNGNTGEF